ncbi:MAG TPA: DUF1254 domain-containing protein [Luteibacter sp.]|jgi:hypothetical protein|uniref:DUF1254 domain-containing protein n=1 Tax=Luteibacter sp. TaxID=1886636 RepID=UPI002F3FD8DD
MVVVTPENFLRAETDLYFSAVAVKDDGLGKFCHRRELIPIDNQNIIRENRDTVYSAAVFDLDAGPVSLALPDAGSRFMSMEVIDEDQYVANVYYDSSIHQFTRETIGTRYVLVALRTLLNPSDPDDLSKVRALQDAVTVSQPGGPGRFEIPAWDRDSQDEVRTALLQLAKTMPDTSKGFGKRGDVDPVQRLVGGAAAWGANPQKDAMYLNVTPKENDGKTPYRLTVKDVPVDGFWSAIVYDKHGYIPRNEKGVYAFNNLVATKDPDGGVTIQFGGCDGAAKNCIPIVPDWNYMVRLYRPRREIIEGTWTFPEATKLTGGGQTPLRL